MIKLDFAQCTFYDDGSCLNNDLLSSHFPVFAAAYFVTSRDDRL